MESPILTLIAEALLLYWPAYLANMMPPVAGILGMPGNVPVSTKIFGRNKTIRGMLSGIIGGSIGAAMLNLLGWSWYGTQTMITALLAGAIIGGGALAGDLLKSACKRACTIPSGRPFPPFDQWDFVLGATLVMAFILPVTMPVFLTVLVLTFVLHLVVNIAAYWLGLKEVWW